MWLDGNGLFLEAFERKQARIINRSLEKPLGEVWHCKLTKHRIKIGAKIEGEKKNHTRGERRGEKMAQVSRDQSKEGSQPQSFTPWWSDPGLKEKCCVKREKNKLKREEKIKERKGKERGGGANRDGSSQAVSGLVWCERSGAERKSKAQRARGPKAVRCVYADWSVYNPNLYCPISSRDFAYKPSRFFVYYSDTLLSSC